MENHEIIEKAITTGDFTDGGLLNPDQQRRYVALIRSFSAMLNMVRVVRMTQSRQDIDKLHIGEPVTRGATENDPNYYTNPNHPGFVPKFNRIELSAVKLITDWFITTETFQDNVERSNFEATVMNGITERQGTDLEVLGIQGDATKFAADDSPRGTLLRTLNGWDLQSEAAHIVDVDGGDMSKAVFSAMLKVIPPEFQNDPALRWFMSKNASVSWQDAVSERATDLGDRALQGGGFAPYGIPAAVVPAIPSNLEISFGSTAGPGFLVGTEHGPFEFPASSSITIGVDELAADTGFANPIVVTITAAGETATLDTVQVARLINDALVADGAHGARFGNVARDAGDGRLLLEAPGDGADSQVTVTAQAGTAAEILGLTPSGAPSFPVTDAGGGGVLNDGTFMWLTNPMNLIWGILDGTRIYTKFNQHRDRVESTIYNQVDYEIENLNAMVKAKNIILTDDFSNP